MNGPISPNKLATDEQPGPPSSHTIRGYLADSVELLVPAWYTSS
jgi:hypothetical protein